MRYTNLVAPLFGHQAGISMARANPSRPPTITCRGVWPMSSLSSPSQNSGFLFFQPAIILLSTLACLPAALRTPAASYITIRANVVANAKMGESKP